MLSNWGFGVAGGADGAFWGELPPEGATVIIQRKLNNNQLNYKTKFKAHFSFLNEM